MTVFWRARSSQKLHRRACVPYRRHLIGAYLMVVHLINVHLTGVHLIDVSNLERV